MTTTITARTCEAWFLLEAADLRGLPAPYVVRITDHSGIELGVKTGADLDRWAVALEVDPDSRRFGDMLHRTVIGELHEMAVTVFVVEAAGVSA